LFLIGQESIDKRLFLARKASSKIRKSERKKLKKNLLSNIFYYFFKKLIKNITFLSMQFSKFPK